MKQFIRDYLTFNKRERNGIAVLLIIISLLLIFLNVSDKLTSTRNTDFTQFDKEIAAFETSIVEAGSFNDAADSLKTVLADSGSGSNIEPSYFIFNPNNLQDDEWKRLGLSDKQIATIKNYEAKGGQFRTKEDVKKMYSIPYEQYLKLEPYIQIPSQQLHSYQRSENEFHNSNSQNSNHQFTKSQTHQPANSIVVELNSADSAYLIKVKGIGPFFAKAIIKYREQLGGFAFKEQLMEIWNFDEEKFNAVKDYVFVDEAEVKKLNINTFTAAQLKHPYISWNMANAIENYRKQHGKYKKLDEIKNTDLVDDKTFRKLVYYLTIE